jgi:hypothetical protein
LIVHGRKFALAGAFAALVLAASAQGKAAEAPPVPEGWKVDATAFGDLTGDGVSDFAMVVRQDDPKQVIRNDRLGAEQIDTNPRRLLIFAGSATGFKQIAASDRMIPPAGDVDNVCLVDPLEDGGVLIKAGVLSVNLHYWQSCGGWGTASNTYKFRREGARFRLIGFDRTEFMRNSGEGDELSVNFLTSRKSTTPFAIDDSIPRRLKWSRIRAQKLYLDSVDIEACLAIDQTTNLC